MEPEAAVGTVNFLLLTPEGAAEAEHTAQTAFLPRF